MLALLVAVCIPAGAASQTPDGSAADTPEVAAQRFFDAVGQLRWSAAAAALHPETLALFRFHITSMLDADDDGSFAAAFGAESARIRSWSPERLFAELLRAISDYVPGLLEIMATNTYVYLGHVAEGPDLAHVIARVTPYTDGTAPTDVTTVTVRRSGSVWRVLESPEIDAISTALRGLAFRSGDRGQRPFD